MKNGVVIDTNVVFSSLVSRHSRLRRLLFTSAETEFHCPRFLFLELFKHKERILKATKLPEGELLEYLNVMLGKVNFVEEGAVSIGTWMEARRLCLGTDESDAPFVALALHLECRLWTGDKLLKAGLRAKGFDFFYEPEI